MAWERFGVLLEQLEKVAGERELWVSLLRPSSVICVTVVGCDELPFFPLF